MKKTTLFLFSCILAFSSSTSAANLPQRIPRNVSAVFPSQAARVATADTLPQSTVCTAGQLYNLSKSYASSVKNLTLTGVIDASDVQILRDSMPNLSVLDISGVSIAAYHGGNGTLGNISQYDANTLPDYSFLNPYIDYTETYNNTLHSISLPSGLTSIGAFAFGVCHGLSKITFPTGLTSIGDNAFYECFGISGTVTFPAGLNSIGSDAFFNCSRITNVVVTEGITSLGDLVFEGCNGITSLTLPSSLTTLGSQTFLNCTSLQSITALNSMPPTVGSGCFDNTPSITDVIVPSDDAVTAYKADALGWYSYFPGGVIKKNTATAVSKLDNSKLKVFALGSSIQVDGSEFGERVKVYGVNGELLESVDSKGDRLALPLVIKGVYIVKVGTKSYKVIL
jgi:BspA type Leucine rich repeat region (6 copies)